MSPARSHRLRRANTSERWVALPHAERRRFDRAPLLRFVPLQRLPVRDALCGAAVLRTIPLRRLSFTRSTRASAYFEGQSRPCGFSLCEYDAAELEVRTVLAVFAGAFAPRNPRRLTLHDRIKPRLRSFLPWIRLGASECGHAQERPVTSSASASSIRRIRNGHASPCSMEAMFRYRLDPSRPGRANGPSLISPGGAPGVNRRSSQVCSRLRVADRFRSSRAHVPVRPTTRPDALYSGLTRR